MRGIATASLRSVTEWPDILNIDSWIFGDHLAERKDRVALRLDDGTVTYGQVDSAVSAYAHLLLSAGVEPSDRVLIVLPDGLDYVAALFSVFRVGAVAVMVNPSLASDALVGIIDRSRASVAVVAGQHLSAFSFAERQSSQAVATVAPDQVDMDAGHRVAAAATSPDDPAIWLFSGGTTGLPKAVPQTHRSLVNTTRLYGQGSLGLGQDDITMAIPKLYFGYATGSNLLFPLSVGASTVLFEEHPTPDAVFRRIGQHQPTVLVNVPSAVNQMLSHPGAQDQDLSSLRLATSAGEALPESLYRRWKETFGVELLDGLGTAEMWHIFVTNVVGDVRPGTLGKVVPGFEIKACDEDGNEVPPGDVGRLWVKGDSLGLGYFEDPAKTEDAFRGEWFVGGDLVSIDEDGYVTHRGRADDAIKVKGKWFRPQEVESVLLDHEAVKEVAVVAVNDEAGLAKPVAFVVPTKDVTEQELIDWVLDHIEAYKHPRMIYLVERLPQTHLGKVDRSELKRRAV